ncbi:MAG TPA: hypothetical protein DHW42_10485 [Candidatus Marinimicrobia bacterium]|nr:hypothetical protein [Candidatus Neomarinimicrobiota bacterium]
MNTKNLICIFVVSLLACSQNIVAQDKVGTSSAQFLQIPVGGKAISMGGAFTAVSDDPAALYWNPGAISRIGKNCAYVSNTNWLVGSNHVWIGAQVMVTGHDAIGISLNNLDYGASEKVTTVEQSDGTGEYWEAQDVAIALTYARNITDRFSIGGSIKYISEEIWHETSSQFALDLGLLFITQFNGLRIGASMRNFGGELKMEGRDLMKRIDLDPESEGNNETIVANLKTDEWPIPLTFSVGAAMPIINSKMLKLTIAADAVRPTDNSETINVGGELFLYNLLSMRAGYQTLFRDDSEQGLTFGMGLKIPVPYADIIVDYSYQQFGILGDVQTTALSIGF